MNITRSQLEKIIKEELNEVEFEKKPWQKSLEKHLVIWPGLAGTGAAMLGGFPVAFGIWGISALVNKWGNKKYTDYYKENVPFTEGSLVSVADRIFKEIKRKKENAEKQGAPAGEPGMGMVAEAEPTEEPPPTAPDEPTVAESTDEELIEAIGKDLENRLKEFREAQPELMQRLRFEERKIIDAPSSNPAVNAAVVEAVKRAGVFGAESWGEKTVRRVKKAKDVFFEERMVAESFDRMNQLAGVIKG